jgi:hypothetical protein
MKTSKFYISLLFVILLPLFFHFENLKADTVICMPDCFNDSFKIQNPLSVQFHLGPCRYVADFYIRKACGIWCDILLWRVRALDSNCNNYDPKTMCDIAEAQIIQFLINDYNQNGTNSFWYRITGTEICRPTSPGECTYFWRVSKATCWKFYLNPDWGHYPTYWGAYGYCMYDYCCLTWYKVCMDQFGQILVTQVESQTEHDCPTQSGMEDCIQVCD